MVPSDSDPDSLARWLEHADWLRQLARQLVRDGGEAEGVAHEVLLVASDSSVQSGVSDRSWLAGIARKLVSTRRRGERRMRAREVAAAKVEHGGPSALDDAAILERQRSLLAQVEGLPEGQRRVVLARFFEGLPPRKIAAAEGVPVSTIHTRLQRGLESLRKSLDGAYGDRRNWATWVAPMGWSARKARWAGATLVAGALVVAVPSFMAFNIWRTKP